jgi:hypothetical protein
VSSIALPSFCKLDLSIDCVSVPTCSRKGSCCAEYIVRGQNLKGGKT